jgi:RimJ/RimL family protein N-acetyltransferase
MAYLETQRLILRTWMPSDATAYARITAQPAVMEFLASGTLSTQAASAWIEETIEEEHREGFSAWPVLRKEDGMLVGRCGLHRMQEGQIEIAWVFDSGVWGKGYATEAGSAVLAFAFGALHVDRIVALIHPRNARSVAVAHRLGMRFDRVVRAYRRDLLRYLIEQASG